MRRREFLAFAASVAAPKLMPIASAHAEGSRRRPRVVWLGAFPETPLNTNFFEAFVKGMQEQGHVEGRDYDLVRRSAGGVDKFPAVIDEVIRSKPDLILAPATLEAVAIRRATATIPIVCGALADAVHLGLIASEARPGGNVTGIEPYVGGLPAKQIELAREIVPRATKIGLLTNQEDPKGPPQARDLKAAGEVLGLQIVSANASKRENIADALQTLASEKVDVAIVLQTNLLLLNSSPIAASALEKRLPTVYGYREHVVAGGLVSYGVDLRWCFRRAAYFVTRILGGTAPGELPIEFPDSLWLAANLKTAKALGITIPASLLARADEVIE